MAVPTIEATQLHEETANATGTGAITLSLGTISTGDIIFCFVSLDGTNGNPSGSGNNSGAMSTVRSVDEGTVEGEVLYAVQGGTVDTTITISWTGNEECRVTFVRVAGASTGVTIDTIGSDLTGEGTSASPVPATSTETDSLYFGFVSVDRDRVVAGDAVSGTGWTEVGTSGNTVGAGGVSQIIGSADQASVGTPATPTFDSWLSDGIAAYVFNVNNVSITPPDVTITSTHMINQSAMI
jgi:hypothetical protein